ncbi:MAG: NfeD family protein [Gammaproteobacteria bacterium]|nr:NfeD family protein [Gammaproteobacteria bacterium]
MGVMFYIWLGVFIVTLVVELMIPGLVSLWFSIGSLVSLILASFIGDTLIWLQILLFFVVSVASIVLLRPIIVRSRAKDTDTNVDSLKGSVAFVCEDIKPYEVGAVKVNGLVWSAELSDMKNEEIKVGEKVIIQEIKGNKVIVNKYEEK